jgi:hypothetical protein
MKTLTGFAAFTLIIAPSAAVAGPVSLTVQNLGKSKLSVQKTSFCGTLKPTPDEIAPQSTSPAYTTDCGKDGSVAYIDYQNKDLDTCRFLISVVFTKKSYLDDSPGYYVSNVSAERKYGSTAKCKVVSKDATNFATDGSLSAVFSME